MTAQPIHYLAKPEHYRNAPVGTVVEAYAAINGTLTRIDADWWTTSEETLIRPGYWMRRRVISWGQP